jgi:dGTP triphosphohydrolase
LRFKLVTGNVQSVPEFLIAVLRAAAHSFIKTVSNACLLHDIGNPPFGHMGEHAIKKWFKENKDCLEKRWTGFGKAKGDAFKRHLDRRWILRTPGIGDRPGG